MNSKAWVLMPVFNESKSLNGLLPEIKKQNLPVLIVDDGSQDGSAAIAQAQGCRVLSLERNFGKGYAVRQGLHHLLGVPDWQVLILMDSDGQHDPAEIPRFLQAHQDLDADIVVGNRMLSRGDMPWVRWQTNRFMSDCVSRMARQPIADSQCGYRLLKRKVVQRLSLTCERFELESELLIQAGREGFRIASLPVKSIYPPGGSSRIRPLADTVRFLKLLVKYTFSRHPHFRGVAQLG